MTTHSSFRERDVTRFVRGLKKAGFDVGSCEIDARTGNIVAVAKSPGKQSGDSALDQWMAGQGSNAASS